MKQSNGSDGRPPATHGDKAFLRGFGASLVIASAITAAFNVVINPLGYYPTHVLPPLVWATRDTKVELMKASGPAEAIVLGSSRSMKIAPRDIAREAHVGSAFNATVDGARVEDDAAMLAFAAEDLKWPLREVVLGLDIEAFHNHVGVDTRNAGCSELRAQLPIAIRAEVFEEAAYAAVSAAMTRESLHALSLFRSGTSEPPMRFDADGFLRVGTFDLSMKPITPAQYALATSFDAFTGLDERRKDMLESIAATADRHGMRVHAFITPLHSGYREYLEQTRGFAELRRATVALLESIAQRHPSVTWRDFTDARSFGGDDSLFYDVQHVNADAAALIVRALFSGVSGARRDPPDPPPGLARD